MKKLSLSILILCLSMLIAACGEEPIRATVGNPAPDFTLVDITGKDWTLSELKGQVVFINFWATWCPPCREEMPSMQRLYTKLPKDKFKMLAILNRDAPSMADVFVQKAGATMPILDDQSNTVGSKYGLTGLPETYIIDKQGVLREKFIGPAQWDSPQFIQMLMTYINE
ncbi:MAG: TlpA family protein disulfide reductase [Desulfobulbaceae bacterium]|nr:TlpA family protein disulfide reductase [Desulfobulbaceae bacterium]